jgi:hypothetical protein
MTMREKLEQLLTSEYGCGPLVASVVITADDQQVRIKAEFAHQADLPQAGGTWRPAFFDLAVRNAGTEGGTPHIAYAADFDNERPHLRFWGAPKADVDMGLYSSRHERIDANHCRFEAAIPMEEAQ